MYAASTYASIIVILKYMFLKYNTHLSPRIRSAVFGEWRNDRSLRFSIYVHINNAAILKKNYSICNYTVLNLLLCNNAGS